MAMRSGVTVTDVFTVGVEDAGDDSSQSAEVDAVSLSVLSSAVAAQNKKSSSETVCCVCGWPGESGARAGERTLQ